MAQSNEAFSRIIIDAQHKDQGWNLNDQNSVRVEYVISIGRADYVLCDRHGRVLAIVEAKRFSVNPIEAREQAKAYAQELNVPYIFLANGKEILFWEWEREAFPRPVKTFFKQDDLERRFATRQVRQELMSVPIDTHIAGGKYLYQTDCIDTLSREITQGRRKLLVEMATGTGKTRTAAALIKLLALDIDDHIDPTTREWVTLDENGNMVFPEVSEQKAAELGARFEAWLLKQNDLTPNEESWLRMVGNQLRANADTWDEFSPQHFAFHPFTLMGGYTQAVRVFGGEDRLYALLIGLNDAVFKTSGSGKSAITGIYTPPASY